MVDDSRARTKVWLDEYLAAGYYATMGHIYEDNGTTEASNAVMYSLPNVPVKLLFFGTLTYDAVFTIGEPTATVTQGYNHVAYKYQEEIPVTIYAVDKTGLTAVKMLWQAELKLRKIAEAYFSGSLRVLKRTKPSAQYLGGFFLYSVECVLSYTRSSEVTPTLPTITWGPSASPTGTFTFPNCLKVTLPNVNNDVFMQMPGRIGNYPQALGAESLEIQLTCDLNMEPWSGAVADTKISWKRPQTNGTKTDAVNFQVFLDIMHNGAIDQAYQKLTLDWGWFYVRLIRMEPLYESSHIITLTFKEYNATAGNAAYKTRWGIT